MTTYILITWYPVGLLTAWYISLGTTRTYNDLAGMIMISLFGYILLLASIFICIIEAKWWNKKLPWVK